MTRIFLSSKQQFRITTQWAGIKAREQESYLVPLRKGDLVQVTTGADRGKQGRVLALDLDSSRVRVEGVRMQTRHMKPGRKGARQGGIIEQEGYLHVSNVMLVNPADSKPGRARVENRDGQRVRIFVRDGELVPDATVS
jgi:large subunit ribosomal protein L24